VRNKFVLVILAVFVQAIFAQELAPVTNPAAAAAVSEPVPPAADSTAVQPSEEQLAADSAAVPPVAEPEPPPAVAEPAPAPVVVPPPVAVREPINFNISFKFGVRAGIGLSHFRNHEYLRLEDVNSGNASHAVINSTSAVKMNPAFGFSAGIISNITIISIFSVAPELQYSLYRSNQKVIKEQPKTFDEVHNTGVYLHVFEIPLFFRASFLNKFHAELGPQFGFNLFSNIYKDANYYRPDLNLFAFGLAGGAGMNVTGSTRVDIRGHFGFLEYAENVKGGYPWNIQLGVSQFIF
jgi:hypothetical protein